MVRQDVPGSSRIPLVACYMSFGMLCLSSGTRWPEARRRRCKPRRRASRHAGRRRHAHRRTAHQRRHTKPGTTAGRHALPRAGRHRGLILRLGRWRLHAQTNDCLATQDHKTQSALLLLSRCRRIVFVLVVFDVPLCGITVRHFLLLVRLVGVLLFLGFYPAEFLGCVRWVTYYSKAPGS